MGVEADAEIEEGADASADSNRPGVVVDELCHDAQESALAGSVTANDREAIALADSEVDV
jgi:hypothetical protein